MMLIGLAITIFWLSFPPLAKADCTNCTLSIAEEMNTGGGWLMFGVGIVSGALVLMVGWYLLKRRREQQAAAQAATINPASRIIATHIALPHLQTRGFYERIGV